VARNREKTLLFRVLHFVLATPVKAVASLKYYGLENVPATGAFLVVRNHFTNADPVTIGMAVYRSGRMPHFLAKQSLWKVPVFGWLLRSTHQIPVDRHGVARGSGPIEAAGGIVELGGSVVIFPEGSLTRDPDLWPMRGKTGAARIALATKIPVIPAAHWGDQAILPANGGRPRLWPRPKVTLRFGEAIDLSAYYDKPVDAALLSEVTTVIMQAITDVVAEVRGEVAPPERWNPVAHGQSETGKFIAH
jgi:1-acyl-sn-glycerol-3-phosphate acyltransferase